MHSTVEAFLHFGYLIVFGWVLVEQLGVPLPSTPILLTAGTLTATHHMRIEWLVVAVMAASAIADSAWFQLGGRYGSAVTHWICRFSLEAASCVRKTEDVLTRHGSAALLMAKFIPGLNTMAAPLAGQSKMRYRTFLMYDMAGTFLWVTTLVLVGRFFGDAIRRNGVLLHWLSRSAFVLVVLVVIGIVVYRIVKQQRFLRKIRTLRIEPNELKAMMDRGDKLYIVDLRHPLDILPDPRVLPGAIRLLPNELIARNAEIPRDRDVVLYCTCPSEATSAKIALTMRRFGVERIRPLRGGFDEWKQQGYPLIEIVGPIVIP
ncbi:MAG: VTT domain-containing protein [Acidobacteriaceae bacterium]|jgi:membrane protein DedA with SNARE-associated domain/rhodanese-related sulfurtransferase